MIGNSFLIDTNIALYLLSGNATIVNILDKNYCYLSFISQLELLAFKKITATEELRITKFISDCFLIDINDDIKKNVIAIRKQHNLKLPDCIIAATSMHLNIPLLTGDKGFKGISDLSVILYNE